MQTLKKIRNTKTKIILLGMILSILSISCNKDDNNSKSTMSVQEANVNAKIDIANDGVSKIVEDQLGEDDGISGRGTTGTEDFLPACATVTRGPVFGSVIKAVALSTKTIDFGTTLSVTKRKCAERKNYYCFYLSAICSFPYHQL